MPHVVIVGSVNMDLVVRVDHMPAPGETVLGSEFQMIPGGKGANQAVAAARLGAEVTMIGRVGHDDFGSRLLAGLRAEGIDVSHVAEDKGAPSGIAMITLDKKGQNSIIVASGANMCLTPKGVSEAWKMIRGADAVVMQLEVPLPCIKEAAKLAQANGTRVILNPAPAQQLPDDLLKRVDVLAPNESETSLLTGLPVDSKPQAELAAHALLERGTGAVVLTLGSRGAMLLERNVPTIKVAAHDVDVIDTTAAGDAFVAALAVALAEGASMENALHTANAAGALAVTRMGAQPSMPTREEVDRLLQQL